MRASWKSIATRSGVVRARSPDPAPDGEVAPHERNSPTTRVNSSGASHQNMWPPSSASERASGMRSASRRSCGCRPRCPRSRTGRASALRCDRARRPRSRRRPRPALPRRRPPAASEPQTHELGDELVARSRGERVARELRDRGLAVERARCRRAAGPWARARERRRFAPAWCSRARGAPPAPDARPRAVGRRFRRGSPPGRERSRREPRPALGGHPPPAWGSSTDLVARHSRRSHGCRRR